MQQVYQIKQSVINIFIIIKMRQKFRGQLDRQQSPRRNRSGSKTKEFKQFISKINASYPKGHYIAYCIVSKQSKNGFFLNERLLVLDTFHEQLKYYSRIPLLPLNRPQDLVVPKQVINFKEINNLQFIPQKIRIGRVVVKWKVKKQPFSWKLIMGNNQIAKQFSQLVYSAFKAHQKRQSNEVFNNVDETTRGGNMNQDKNTITQKDVILKQSNLKYQKFKVSTPSYLNNQSINKVYQNESNFKNEQNFKTVNLSELQQVPFNNDSSFSIKDSLTNILIDQQSKVFKKDSIINLKTQQDVLQIRRIKTKQRNSFIQKNNFTVQWLQSTIQKDKAVIYNKFVHKCFKRIEKMMQNFISSHMNHEQMDNNKCLLKDDNIEIIYLPIIQSTSSEMLPESLIRKIREQEEVIRQWQCLNFISGYHSVSQYKIIIPMCCILNYKSFKFFCKNSIQSYEGIERVEQAQISSQIKDLQARCHVKLCNGKEQIYKIDNQLGKIIYFDRLSCLPQSHSRLPINANFIQNYVLEGKISNSRDVQALETFISDILIVQITNKFKQLITISTVQMMQIMHGYGLSQHYLPMFVADQSLENERIDSFSRLIYTEMLACAFEWEMRKRMQLQTFKNKQFGFAIHQIQLCLKLFFQEDQYFLTVLNNHLLQYFKCRIPSNALPLDKYIICTSFLISVFIRLSLNCKLSIEEQDYQTWYWEQKNIFSNMQLSAFISSDFLRVECFSLNAKLFRKSLVSDINFQINRATTLDHVFKCLNVKSDNNGCYQIPPIYDCLSTDIKKKINFYLSHYISPLSANTDCLQQQIYFDEIFHRFNTNSLQYLTSLNKARWLIKGKKIHEADLLICQSIEKAIIWGHNHILVHLYNFACKYKLNNGEINSALNYSLKALSYAQQLYKTQKSILVELLVAQQAFESANLHYSVHDYSKALELYSTIESILNKINTQEQQIKLNAQFMKVYINKSSIYLLFNQRKQCLDSCLVGIKNSKKFSSHQQKGKVARYEFKIYTILFRFYQINKMRKQMLQISKICSSKYFEDRIASVNDPDTQIVVEIVKMLWVSIIKQIEIAHLQTTEDNENDINNFKQIDLNKVKSQILSLKQSFGDTYRYSTQEMVIFLGSRLKKRRSNKHEWLLLNQIIDCLIVISYNNRDKTKDKLYDLNNADNGWLVLQSLIIIAGEGYLVGQIEDSMRIYRYQI